MRMGYGVGFNLIDNARFRNWRYYSLNQLELELIETQMTQKPMLRAEVGMRVRCANKASAECIMRGRGIGQNSRKNYKKRGICG